MALSNREIAAVFDQIADMLQLKEEKIFTILAYRNAAEAIRAQPRDLRAIASEGGLEDIPGVGKAIASKIEELLETGQLEFLERLKAEIPVGVVDFLHIGGIGPKKAILFWQQAGLTSIDQLEAFAREGKIRTMPGFGAKSEAAIVAGIEAFRRKAQNTRIRLGDALPLAERILAELLTIPGVTRGEIAGSIRRARPTIGDVDLLITADEDDGRAAMARFVGLEMAARVLANGESKSSIELHNGTQVDLRVLPHARWGTALQYFSGSQAHNIRIRELARARGFSINEHAFTPLAGGDEIVCDDEAAVYAQLGLPWIPPELREDMGEIDAAQHGRLPRLIELRDIRADLHMHTDWSDGTATLREMVLAAKARGREYIVITDHSRSATVANGLSIERLLNQQQQIRAIDAEMNGAIRVLHGSEVEIKADGELDFPDDVLSQLDFVIASPHVGLRQPREQITQRLINALSNPHVDLIGHPTGQLILEREGADLDIDAVFAAAARHGKALEINANPHRLDLEAGHARRAVELGIVLAIDTDAHAVGEMDLLRYGVMTARRGWVQAEQVINTWPLDRFLEWVGAHEL